MTTDAAAPLDPAVRDALAALVRELAHELRNPLASMQGCAQTLADRGDDLPASTRTGLAHVVVRHAHRLDWLMGALLALARLPDGLEREVDLAAIAEAAGELAGVPVHVHRSQTVAGVEGRIRLAVEAVVLALASDGCAAWVDGEEVTVRAPGSDAYGGGRAWKLALAETIVRHDGGSLHVEGSPGNVEVVLRFAPDGDPRCG
ncbi:MAG TPA: histidine kinase dimerization/phospho-acceptor domain-containing protein [Actinomycetota bacterium]|nr:histidine kinase dimerization/phospho-acceptor domain-containing protein [Actinomycetota bacterium]